MTHDILEPAAFASLAVAAFAIFLRLGGTRLPRQLKVLRFRNKLRGLDQVVSAWEHDVAVAHPAGRFVRDERRNRKDRPQP